VGYYALISKQIKEYNIIKVWYIEKGLSQIIYKVVFYIIENIVTHFILIYKYGILKAMKDFINKENMKLLDLKLDI